MWRHTNIQGVNYLTEITQEYMTIPDPAEYKDKFEQYCRMENDYLVIKNLDISDSIIKGYKKVSFKHCTLPIIIRFPEYVEDVHIEKIDSVEIFADVQPGRHRYHIVYGKNIKRIYITNKSTYDLHYLKKLEYVTTRFAKVSKIKSNNLYEVTIIDRLPHHLYIKSKQTYYVWDCREWIGTTYKLTNIKYLKEYVYDEWTINHLLGRKYYNLKYTKYISNICKYRLVIVILNCI